MDLNGLLLLDKPVDWTSHDVVQKVRRLLHLSQVGHAGTLDPFASGLLVLLLGQATKLSDYVLSQDKQYLVKMQFGRTTDSMDITGQVLTDLTDIHLSQSDILKAIDSCLGAIELAVPLFSATKVKGKKLYEYARAQQEIEPPKKVMSFTEPKVVSVGPNFVEVEIHCSKGSYIRSWVAEIGKQLGCGAVTVSLRRLASYPHSIGSAVTLGVLEELTLKNLPVEAFVRELQGAYIPVTMALPYLTKMSIAARDERLLMNGQISREVFNRLIPEQKRAIRENLVVAIQVLSQDTGKLLSVLEAHPGNGLRIKRVFK